MYRKKIVYIGFSTIHGFRHTLGVLERIPSPPTPDKGNSCTDNMMKNFIREPETIKKNQMKFYN